MGLLSALVAWSLKNRPVVLLLALLAALVGLRSARVLRVDAVPDVTNVQVQIITAAPALSPVEIEQYVTVAVERAMAGMPRSTEIRSISRYGLSVVTVVFHDDTDIYFARQQVSERLRDAQEAIPARYGRPEMGPISTGLGEVYQFTVKNDHLSLMELEDLLDWTIVPQLRMVPGIIEVNSFGGEDRQFQVMLEPGRLQAAGVSIAQVIEALERSNASAGGGYLEFNREHFVIGTEGLVRNVEDLRSVVIGATQEGVPITIANVGEVQIGPRLRRGAASMDGEGEVVVGVALMLMGENAREVTVAVKERLRALEKTLPEGTRVESFYDRSLLVDRTLGTVARNLAEGAALVVLVLLVLLGDLRGGLVVASTIPLALLFAVTVMEALHLSGNLMSLGAIDFGLLVDGAVIIVENAARRLAEREEAAGRPLTEDERVAVVQEATLEVRAASVFGEAIIAIVYLPVLALVGVEGKLFRPMATTVLLALGGSFLLSLTVVPVLTSYFLRPAPGGHRETAIFRFLHRLYAPTLDLALGHRGVIIGLSTLLLGGAVALGAGLGAEFLPQLDEGDLLVEARRLPGIALTESVAMNRRIERALRRVPEVLHVVSRTGAPAVANDPMGFEEADIYLMLRPREAWRPGLDRDTLRQQISDAVGQAVPEVSTTVLQPIQMRTNELVAGVKSDAAVLFYGRDLATLERLGARAQAALGRVPGAVEVRVEQVAGLRYLRVRPDRNKLARYGLTIDDVNQATETMAVGRLTGEVLEGERHYGIAVRTAHRFDGDLDALRSLPLRAVNGQIVPLGDVADLRFEQGPAEVSREQQSRRIGVEFNVRGRDLGSVVAEAQAAIEREVALPTGYRAEWGGQFRHYEEARERLLVAVPAALGLILFLLWMAFRSVREALVIFANVPFAAVGGVAALWARGLPFSISAGVGFIALFGVAVLNGLVLVSFARHLESAGQGRAAAIREAALLRLRPVLMTALVAALGFIPMALSTSPGSEVQRPLATVVIGGILSATALTLLLLPVLYALVGPSPTAPSPTPDPR
jgi:cobalt-zinc-cadmium resistance protein CzcA